jgi:hypothetical protein
MVALLGWNYEKLPEPGTKTKIDQEESQAIHRQHLIDTKHQVWYGITIVLLAVYAFSVTILLASNRCKSCIGTHNDKHKYTCGNSVSEAMKRGCKFDQVIMGWAPVQCPRSGTEEFLAYGEQVGWRYYSDHEGTIEIPERSLPTAVGTIYSTEIEHSAHCAFLLRRVFWTAEQTGKIAFNWEHLHHCAMYMLNASSHSISRGEINTGSHIHFDSC